MRSMASMLLLVAFCAPSIPAGAGTVHPVPITIVAAEGLAYGRLAEVPFRSPSSILPFATLECNESRFGAIVCLARDEHGLIASCSIDATTQPGFTDNARAMDSASFVALFWDPATGICTDMRLIKGSQFLPGLRGPRTGLFNTEIHGDHFVAHVTSSRFSDNALEFVSCDIWANGHVFCGARDRTGATASCTTTEAANPSFAASARAIDSAARVRVEFDPASGACQRMVLTKGSQFLP